MSKNESVKPDTIQSLIDLYNEKEIPQEDFIKRICPLLEEQRRNNILVHLLQIMENDPSWKGVPSPHHAELWARAEMAYDAELKIQQMHNPQASKTLKIHQSSSKPVTETPLE